MRIKKLNIESVRGIVHTEFVPNGDSVVIYGPNGSGKSAVVDAIDFLLTGKISRLVGAGTAGITLSRHGKHITTDVLTDCYVEAELLLDGIPDTVIIKRYISNPSDIEVEDKYKEHLMKLMEITEKHQFLLTRREILRFITAENSSRSEQIQKLLNIDDIGVVRSQLVGMVNKARNEKLLEDRQLQNLKAQLSTIIGVQSELDEISYLAKINELRSVFGATALAKIEPNNFLVNIDTLNKDSSNSQNKVLKQKEIIMILDVLVSRVTGDLFVELSTNISDLIQSLHKLRDNNHDLSQIKLLGLLRQGSGLLGWSEEEYSSKFCPLCLSNYDSSKLRIDLKNRIKKAEDLERSCQHVENVRDSLVGSVTNIKTAITDLVEGLDRSIFKKEMATLTQYSEKLDLYATLLNRDVSVLIEDSGFIDLLIKLINTISTYNFDDFKNMVLQRIPEGTSREEAFSLLTRLQSKSLEITDQLIAKNKAEACYSRAQILRDAFEVAAKEVFDELFSSIKDRFVYLYKKLHGVDENNFDAQMVQQSGGVSLSVDFYGYGQYPPHALHSEGHQDSMGLCLFLALNERVCEGKIEIVVLDDVVMSVDSQHRKSLCKLLRDEFPNKQFIITTHDTTWATQMRSAGLVRRQNMIKFYEWNVESGPKYEKVENNWNLIKDDVSRNEISSASSRLRHMLEEFFLNLCVDLQANVPCKIDKDWTLGDTLPNAVSAFRSHIREAKNLAQRNKNQILHDQVALKESEFQQIYERTEVEQWAINKTTHYTHWANLIKEDFEPVVEAYEDLINSLTCQSCHQSCHLLFGSSNLARPEMMQCECGSMSYKLK